MRKNELSVSSNTFLDLLRMSAPMVISQGAFAAMIFTDRYFLAQVSPTHMASALGGGVAWFFCISLFNGILAYANALVAQYLGAGKLDKCSRVITQGIILSTASLPLIIIIWLLFLPSFKLMGHAEDQVELEKIYYSLLMIGTLFTLYKTCLASFFSGTGKTHVVMIADVSSIILNIPLSYVLVFGKAGFPESGIAGAALGTVISTVFAVALFCCFYFYPSNSKRFSVMKSFTIDRGIINRYVRLGLPSGMESFLNVAAFNLFLLMFQAYGITEAASAAIVFNWDILSFVPLLGLNIAIMSLTGRHTGSGDLTRIGEVARAGYLLGVGYSLFLASTFILLRTHLVDFFIFEEDQYSNDIRELAGFMMYGLATYVLAEGALQVAAGILRGAGDTRWIMYASVSLHWAMLVSQLFIIKVWGLDPRISWLAFVVMILGIALTFILRMRGAKWRSPERRQQVMSEN